MPVAYLFRWKVVALALAMLFSAAGCRREGSRAGEGGPVRLVFKHQPFWGDPAPFRALIAEFEQANPGVDVVTELLPNSSDIAHQYFLTSLEGGAQDYDAFIVDVVWVPEFARAGWIADLTPYFPAEEIRADFLPGAAEAVLVDGKVFALPWYVDVGLLYYRKDLVPEPPRTYAELVARAREVQARHPGMQGFLWQGRQYEGLVCNVYEAIWGHGGATLKDGRLALTTPEAKAALVHLRALVEGGASPPSVTSAAEEDARRAFQDGLAVFQRNWPYAWEEAEKPGSPIRGKVGFAPLPTVSGEPGYGALGGWQLALNAHVAPHKRDAAVALLRHLSSAKANLLLALNYGRNPPRRAIYEDPEVRARSPFIAQLRPIFERARPRPVTPYYTLLSDVLQSEFSAVVTGVRSADDALSRAQRRSDHVMGVGDGS